MSAERIAEALDGKRSGDSWICKCPCHDDSRASLSVTDKNGRTLIHCHAGCDQDEVISVLKDRGLWPGKNKILFSIPSVTPAHPPWMHPCAIRQSKAYPTGIPSKNRVDRDPLQRP